jgi:mRNA interferase MazF
MPSNTIFPLKATRSGEINAPAIPCGVKMMGIRPVLIIQNNIGNKHSPTTIVAAITSKAMTKASLPTHHLLNNASMLNKESIVLLEQIRTIDKQRLKAFIGTLDQEDILRIDAPLRLAWALIGGLHNERKQSCPF